MVNSCDDPEYKKKLYQKLLDRWGYTFGSMWKYANDEAKSEDMSDCAQISKKIYEDLSDYENYWNYSELSSNLKRYDKEELEQCFKLLPQFKKYIEKNNLADKNLIDIKIIYPHIVGSYYKLDKKIPFEEYIEKISNILQKIEDKEVYPKVGVISRYIDDTNDKQSLRIKLPVLEEAVKFISDGRILTSINFDLKHLGKSYPELYTEAFKDVYIEKILPRAIQRKDIFGVQSNKWGCWIHEKGIAQGVGAANFAYKCYMTPITPRGINDLVQMAQENLAGDLATHEAIRKDALLLNSWIPRDPVHDSSPGINDLIKKMVEYYDATSQNKEKAYENLKKANDNISFWGDKVFDIKKYDEYNPRTHEKNIDILRRINDNMSQNKENPPVTENEMLNRLAEKASKNNPPLLKDMLLLTQVMNKAMLKAIDDKQLGFSPEMVNLIAWTDRKLGQSLNNMDFEYQLGFYKSEKCYDVLLFSELTHSASEIFDKKSFDEFYEKKVKNAFDMEEAYKNIGNHQNQLMFGLFDLYDENCVAMDSTKMAKIMTDGRKERACSGNSLKALQNLTVYKEPSTKIGEKTLKDRQKRLPYRKLYLINENRSMV